MRCDLVWLFLLLQGLSISCCQAAGDATRDDQKPLANDGAGAQRGQHAAHTDIITGQPGEEAVRQPGADQVDAAMIQLRKIYNPSQHKRSKRHVFWNTALRWLIKAVPSFTSSQPTQYTSNKAAITGPLLDAVYRLQEASHQNNTDGLYLLAEMNFWGNYSHPRDFKAAFDHYQRLANLGNSSGMYMVGLMYSTGIGDAVERDQAKALLYYTFAANAGHTRAEMTVAYRHASGIATPKSCETAAKYYKRVADKAIAWYRSGPPGGMTWASQPYRIADENGGVYGEGASYVSAGINALRAHPNSDAYASIEDVIEYLDLLSQKGDFKSSLNLARLYYDGQRGLDRNLFLAKKYFFMVALKYWKKEGTDSTAKPGLDKAAARAAGYIGRMYMRGEIMEQNFDKAKFWFDRGIKHGDAQSQYFKGVLLMNRYSGPRNVPLAIEFFTAAARQEFMSAQVEMGAIHLDQGTYKVHLQTAYDYFELAARYGHIEAQYYIAEMIYNGVGKDMACLPALNWYKSVSEKADPVVSSWTEANQAYEDGDIELALLGYLVAAEQGYEKAQNNVAYLLDTEQSSLPLPSWLVKQKPSSGPMHNPSLSLIEWTRSSRQSNVDALVKMGDYYLSGIGAERDVDKAVQCYAGASEHGQSAQALYNLGWMHEHGVGLETDYHLAKRYYDQALAMNEEAYLPVMLSLLKLRMKSAWNTFTHGKVNSIRDEPVQKKDRTISEWIADFLKEDAAYYDSDADYDGLYDDGMPGGDGGGSTSTGMGPGDDEFEDSLTETLIIIGFAAVLVGLIYYRRHRQQQAPRQQEEARAAAQGGAAVGGAGNAAAAPAQNMGVFPAPGDPDRMDWAVGGVGH